MEAGKRKKEHFFTLKKITKRKHQIYDKKGKTFEMEPFHDETKDIASPPKFLNPLPFHRTLSDMIVFDELEGSNKYYVSALHSLFSIKNVKAISHNKDFMLITLEDLGNYPFSPVKLITQRLRSLNNKDAHDLANSLTKYAQSFDLIDKMISSQNFTEPMDLETLMHLKNFFKNFQMNSISERTFYDHFSAFQAQNPNLPNFVLVYSDFKPLFGTRMNEMMISQSMKRILPCDDLSFIDDEFFCVETAEYFKIMSETTKRMHMASNDDCLQFNVKTKIGMNQLEFKIRTFFVETGLGGRSNTRVFLHFTCLQNAVLEEILTKLKMLERDKCLEIGGVSFKKKEKKIESSEDWNKLIQLYFTQSQEKTRSSEQKQ